MNELFLNTKFIFAIIRFVSLYEDIEISHFTSLRYHKFRILIIWTVNVSFIIKTIHCLEKVFAETPYLKFLKFYGHCMVVDV